MKHDYPKLISSKVHNDNRGYLQEIYKRKNFRNNFKFAILTSSKKNKLKFSKSKIIVALEKFSITLSNIFQKIDFYAYDKTFKIY